MDFTLVPTMKPFTVITSPEPDRMNTIHCCTIRSVLYFIHLPSLHGSTTASWWTTISFTQRWSSSDAAELQKFQVEAIAVATHTQQGLLFSPFLRVFTSKSRTEGRWVQCIKKVLEVGAHEEEFGSHTRVLLMHSRIPCLSLSQYWTPALNRNKSEIGRDITK